MIEYSHFFALIVGAGLSSVITWYITTKKPRSAKATKFKVISPAQQPSDLLPTVSDLGPNEWKLSVNGAAKFDICVEWSDDSIDILTGQAPREFIFRRKLKCVPICTRGIPPEWSDDGISYEWSLNGFHWN